MIRRSFLAFSLALCCTFAAAGEGAKQLLLIGQMPDNHPRRSHEYTPGMRLLAELLEDTPNLQTKVVSADGAWAEGPKLLSQADGAVLFVSQGAKWLHDEPRRLQAFQKLAERGGALVVLHWGMGTQKADYIAGMRDLWGGCHGGPDRRYKIVEETWHVAAPKHPIARGVDNLQVKEEWYYKLKFAADADNIQPIIQVPIEGSNETVCWAWQRPDGGRSFGFTGLHFHDNWQHPQYRRLIGQGTLWTLKLPIPPDGLDVTLSEKTSKLPID